jgi:hypothetical protein
MIMTGKCICSKVLIFSVIPFKGVIDSVKCSKVWILNPLKGAIDSVNLDPQGWWVWQVSRSDPRSESGAISVPLIYKWADIKVPYCAYLTKRRNKTTYTDILLQNDARITVPDWSQGGRQQGEFDQLVVRRLDSRCREGCMRGRVLCIYNSVGLGHRKCKWYMLTAFCGVHLNRFMCH